MWQLIRRSVGVNRAQFIGSTVAITAAIALLLAAGLWLQAGLSDPALSESGAQLTTIAGSFIGIAALIAGMTVASSIATGLRERRRQFALLAAVGATHTRVRRIIFGETLLLLVPAIPVGVIAGWGMAWLSTPLLQSTGLVPVGYGVPFDATAAAAAVGIMLAVSLIAAWWASRQSLRVSAAEAVRESQVESSALGAGRRITALVVFAAGLVSAAMPLVLPGLMGVAFATVSTFLFITALALVGPVIASAVATVLGRVLPARSGLTLALANIRGFSRRLTAVVVPFALVAALGAVQLSTNAIVASAAREQLSSGLRSDLVGVAAEPAGVEALAALPGVTGVASLGAVNGEVMIDPDSEFPIWEATALAALGGDGVASLVDVDVSRGSLDDLTGDDTIAVSEDALLASETGVGDAVRVRIDGRTVDRTVVAVYRSSLGFGDYLVSDGEATAGTVLVSTDADAASVARSAADEGIALETPAEFAEAAPASSDSTVSSVLLFALLGFGLLAAINTLLTLIRSRRGEFELLTRIGAPRGTIARTVLVETGIAAILAIVLGTVAAIPAAVGAGIALLTQWPALPWVALTAVPAVLLAFALVTAAVGAAVTATGKALAPADA
ncbi:FtsX-like permease family protein [Microbacterium sp. RD1]|uniref:FtsX-like permease family protein n=1 Tax=Microbacterium sp. RD1 TaxID=3457313 RepID=UPI003FA5828B